VRRKKAIAFLIAINYFRERKAGPLALGMEVPPGGALAEPKGELAGWEAPNTH